jgi:hypothetical protein
VTASAASVLESIALAADIDGARAMEQAVQDGRRDDLIPEDRAVVRKNL